MGREGLSRREFLQALPAKGVLLPAASALLLAHESLGCAPSRRAAGPPGVEGSDEPLIRELRLKTVPLEALRAFYEKTIGFMIEDAEQDRFTMLAGRTRITFTRAEGIGADAAPGKGEPFYHFAFNIPEKKVRECRDWQAARSALVPPRVGLRDPEYPEDVWHFRHWNAHSVFFFDPALNIVEYIGRHDLPAEDSGAFSVRDILYASEIGYVVEPGEQEAAAEQLASTFGLAAYPKDDSPRWAMGDERGLVLCLARRGEMWGEHTTSPVTWGVYPTEAVIRSEKAAVLELPGFPYRVESK